MPLFITEPDTSLSGTTTRPITGGNTVAVAGTTTSTSSSSPWAFLDGLSDTFSQGANNILAALANREVSRIADTDNLQTSTGDVFDNPHDSVPQVEQSVFQKYKKEIAIGVGIFALGIIVIVASKK